MTTKPLPIPLERVAKTYGTEFQARNALSTWWRNLKWNKAYKNSKENELPDKAIAFIDLFNAYFNMTQTSSSEKATVYRRLAITLRYMSDETIDLWFKAMKAEYQAIDSASEKDFVQAWKKSFTFSEFIHICNLQTNFEDYWWPTDFAERLANVIRLTGPKDKHTGAPMIFSKRNLDMLYPHFHMDRTMYEREILEAEGVLRLHAAWKTNDDSEKQKIKRFVSAYAEEMDAAIAIVESRYVDTLEQLDSLMQQTGSTVALSEGAL